MERVSRAQIYRVIFILAGAYNIVLGAWAVLAPRTLFEVFDLGTPSHPGIWACLGMVIGLYGLIYLQVAFTDPKRRSSAVVIAGRRIEYDVTRFLIGIGLVGKILGPIGFVLAVRNGELPLRMIPMIALDDLIWWVPFTMYLIDGTRIADALARQAPRLCSAFHVAAAGATLVWIRGGSEVESDPMARAAYIAANAHTWRAAWFIWMIAAISLGGFFCWWAARSPKPRLARIALVVGCAGTRRGLLRRRFVYRMDSGTLCEPRAPYHIRVRGRRKRTLLGCGRDPDVCVGADAALVPRMGLELSGLRDSRSRSQVRCDGTRRSSRRPESCLPHLSPGSGSPTASSANLCEPHYRCGRPRFLRFGSCQDSSRRGMHAADRLASSGWRSDTRRRGSRVCPQGDPRAGRDRRRHGALSNANSDTGGRGNRSRRGCCGSFRQPRLRAARVDTRWRRARSRRSRVERLQFGVRAERLCDRAQWDS